MPEFIKQSIQFYLMYRRVSKCYVSGWVAAKRSFESFVRRIISNRKVPYPKLTPAYRKIG